MSLEFKKIFAKQLRAEVQIENGSTLKAKGVKTYFGRSLSKTDKLLFAFVVERVMGKQVEMQLGLFTERDFAEMEKKFTLDETITDMQLKSNDSIGMPVFVKDKILSEYKNLKGIK